MLKYTIYILIITLLYSCDIGTVDMKKVNQEIENRIKIQKIKKTMECQQNAMKDAEIFVDSIITEITKNSINNDIFFPDRPRRDTSGKHYLIKLDTVSVNKMLDSMARVN